MPTNSQEKSQVCSLEALEMAQKGTGAKLSRDFSQFFDDESYKKLSIDLLSFLEPFSSAFLALRKGDGVQQIHTRNLGSGIELILALLLQRLLSDSAKGGKIFLIDEPEMHLHPTAQGRLAELLIEESTHSQVILSSHSPYLLQRLVRHGRTNVFRFVGEKNEIEIEAQNQSSGYFPWSPSFGEVNFKAFSMPTVELHNELYGYIQHHPALETSDAVDEHLEAKGIQRDREWVNDKTGTKHVSSVYHWHATHHRRNEAFSDACT